MCEKKVSLTSIYANSSAPIVRNTRPLPHPEPREQKLNPCSKKKAFWHALPAAVAIAQFGDVLEKEGAQEKKKRKKKKRAGQTKGSRRKPGFLTYLQKVAGCHVIVRQIPGSTETWRLLAHPWFRRQRQTYPISIVGAIRLSLSRASRSYSGSKMFIFIEQ